MKVLILLAFVFIARVSASPYYPYAIYGTGFGAQQQQQQLGMNSNFFSTKLKILIKNY
jgi:hypothetical protein